MFCIFSLTRKHNFPTNLFFLKNHFFIVRDNKDSSEIKFTRILMVENLKKLKVKEKATPNSNF